MRWLCLQDDAPLKISYASFESLGRTVEARAPTYSMDGLSALELLYTWDVTLA